MTISAGCGPKDLPPVTERPGIDVMVVYGEGTECPPNPEAILAEIFETTPEFSAVRIYGAQQLPEWSKVDPPGASPFLLCHITGGNRSWKRGPYIPWIVDFPSISSEFRARAVYYPPGGTPVENYDISGASRLRLGIRFTPVRPAEYELWPGEAALARSRETAFRKLCLELGRMAGRLSRSED